jgi:ribose transport system ATP-binding protein
VVDLILETRAIEKSFDGHKVLDKIDFNIKHGELHVIGGLNGSGKSTFVKILTGQLGRDSGSLYIEGHQVEIESFKDARKLGMAMVHQEYMLVPDLTLAENIFLGIGQFLTSRKKMNQLAGAILERVGLEIDPSKKAMEIDRDSQFFLEIATAIASKPSLLIIDDALTGLSRPLHKRALKLLGEFTAEGISVLLTTVDPEIMSLGDSLSIIELIDVTAENADELLADFRPLPPAPIENRSGEPFIVVEDLAGTGKILRLTKGETVCLLCKSRQGMREITRAITRQNPFRENAVPIFEEAKNFFERFARKTSSHRVYFRTNYKNNGFVICQMLQKRESFKFRRSFKKGALVNREPPVSVREYLATMGLAENFLPLITTQDRELAEMGFKAFDLFIFLQPSIGLDPSLSKVLNCLLQRIVEAGKIAVIISDDDGFCRELCGRVERVEI